MDGRAFFTPRSVAIVGSMSPGKLGSVLAGQILAGGYHGCLYAVNPKGEGVEGVQGFKSAAEISQPPDLAVVVSPAATVASVLDDCGRAGVRAAVVITSGFSEAGNSAGEREALEVAHRHGLRFIGPNCAGIASASHAFFPTLELRPPAGHVALISQSGALGGVVLGWAQQKGLGISKFISYGNAADLDIVDFLDYIAMDDETKVAAVYIESVRNGRAFIDALAGCARRKPTLVIKAGRTQAGTRATASHTGSMAGSDAVYDAAIQTSGAIRVKSVEELLDLCEGFIHAPRPKGRKIAIVTNSGGPGVLAADRAEEIGLKVSEPSSALQAELRDFLPGHCSLKNPIDLTVEGTEDGYRRTLQAVLKEYDAAVAINVGTAYLDNTALARGVADGAAGSGKTVLASFVPDQLMDGSKALLRESGIPFYPDGERAAQVLAAMASYQAAQSIPTRALKTVHRSETRDLPEPLLEPEAMHWLKDNGIPVMDFVLAQSAEETVQACEQLGYPNVIKVVSPQILHKSDVGGVVINVREASEARAAFERVRKAAEGKEFRGALVYPMVRGAVEVLLGLSTDPQFGPVVAFGLGGIYTEVFRDIALRVAPVDEREALEMIESVKGVKLLKGARGQSPCDLNELARVLARFSALPVTYPQIAEVDLNPVFVKPDGLVVGDVRVIRK